MSSTDPGGCDLACQTKIIINGGNVSKLVEQSCEAIQHFTSNGGKLKHGADLIAQLNAMEDSAVELQKLVLKATGYSGPTGKMLQG